MQTSILPEKNSPENENVELFVMHIISPNLNLMPIHLGQEAKIVLLFIKKVQIPSKYFEFSDVFLEKEVLILLEVSEINQHAIQFQKGQQSSYRPIYSLGLIKLETLKLISKPTLPMTLFNL